MGYSAPVYTGVVGASVIPTVVGFTDFLHFCTLRLSDTGLRPFVLLLLGEWGWVLGRRKPPSGSPKIKASTVKSVLLLPLFLPNITSNLTCFSSVYVLFPFFVLFFPPYSFFSSICYFVHIRVCCSIFLEFLFRNSVELAWVPG